MHKTIVINVKSMVTKLHLFDKVYENELTICNSYRSKIEPVFYKSSI